jgi:hypothetical protein
MKKYDISKRTLIDAVLATTILIHWNLIQYYVPTKIREK